MGSGENSCGGGGKWRSARMRATWELEIAVWPVRRVQDTKMTIDNHGIETGSSGYAIPREDVFKIPIISYTIPPTHLTLPL